MDWRYRQALGKRGTAMKRSRKAEGDWEIKLLLRQLLLCAIFLLSTFALKLCRPTLAPQIREAYVRMEQGVLDEFSVIEWIGGVLERIDVPENLRVRIIEVLQTVLTDSGERDFPATSSTDDSENTLSVDEITTATIPQKQQSEMPSVEAVDTAGAGGQLFWTEQEVPASCTLDTLYLIVPFQMPVKDGEITSLFGWRSHPITGNPDFHRGIDYAAPQGTPIYAAKSGTVTETGWSKVYGKFITLRHTGTLYTTYAHCAAIDVEEGQWVQSGTPIAKVGSTGVSSGAHLHFEVKQEGLYYDPLTAMEQRP